MCFSWKSKQRGGKNTQNSATTARSTYALIAPFTKYTDGPSWKGPGVPMAAEVWVTRQQKSDQGEKTYHYY